MNPTAESTVPAEPTTKTARLVAFKAGPTYKNGLPVKGNSKFEADVPRLPLADTKAFTATAVLEFEGGITVFENMSMAPVEQTASAESTGSLGVRSLAHALGIPVPVIPAMAADRAAHGAAVVAGLKAIVVAAPNAVRNRLEVQLTADVDANGRTRWRLPNGPRVEIGDSAGI